MAVEDDEGTRTCDARALRSGAMLGWGIVALLVIAAFGVGWAQKGARGLAAVLRVVAVACFPIGAVVGVLVFDGWDTGLAALAGAGCGCVPAMFAYMTSSIAASAGRTEAPSPARRSRRRCPACGERNRAAARFCDGCGAALESSGRGEG